MALARLGLLAEETPVLLGGSVLAARHPQLDERIGTLLAARAPKAVARVVTAPPVLGAALLGLDRAGAGEATVQARVRSCLRGTGPDRGLAIRAPAGAPPSARRTEPKRHRTTCS